MKRITYCTIASANYLPRIMALKESLERHRKGVELKILLCEHPRAVRAIEAELNQEFYSPDEIECPLWRHMAFYYDCMEFNTALKPFFLRTLFDEGADVVIYFDPDILVFGSLDELEHLAGRHETVLTPHICEPLEDDGLSPALVDFNRVGQFNLGFCAFSRGERVDRALQWWEARCKRDCISDLSNGLFVDQSWANLFASFLDIKILRSQAYNTAYWNVPQRTLHRSESGTWVTGDGPLVFFHFSGLPLEQVSIVSRHQNRVRAPEGTALHTILSEYAQLLARSPYAPFGDFEYTFARFTDGSPVPLSLRRRFRALSEVERALIVNPFAERTFFEHLQEIRSTVYPQHVSNKPFRHQAVDWMNERLKQQMPDLHANVKNITKHGMKAALSIERVIQKPGASPRSPDAPSKPLRYQAVDWMHERFKRLAPDLRARA